MASVFHLPDLGEGLADAEIVAWHVGAGDHVVTGQPLLSVETDKAVVEVPSPRSGRIAAVHGTPGERVAVGGLLVEFDEDGTHDAGAIVGDAGIATPHGLPAEPVPVGTTARGSGSRGNHKAASPAVRARARALGVDLEQVEGSGPGGAVTTADVEAAAGGAVIETITSVRRAMLVNMTRAGREVVPATVTAEADIDHWAPGADLTARLVVALVEGCRAAPALNAWLDADAGTRTLHRRIDVGIAVDTGEGLFTPVLKDVGDAREDVVREHFEALKKRLTDRTISREDLGGQTITLSNFGMLGGRFASLVVVPPQVAILGAGRAQSRVVAVNGAAAVHRMLPLSLTFDHRAVTGAEAAGFLAAVIAALEAGS